MGELNTSELSFGRVLTEQRKRRGLSRSELAGLSELSYPYVSQLETGLRKPSRKAAASLARALGMGVTDLEAVIPADESDAADMQRVTFNAVSMLSEVPRGPSGPPTDPMSPAPPAIQFRGRPSKRDDLVGHIVDLLEELDSDERIDALADVQKLMLRRMLGRR